MIKEEPGTFYCGVCERVFSSKAALNKHLVDHPEPETELVCPICEWAFSDSVAFENHKLQSGHGELVVCDNCGASFKTQIGYNKHRKFPGECSDAFKKKVTPPRLSNGRQVLGLQKYVDRDASAPETQPSELNYDASSFTPSNVSGIYCHGCQKAFESEAQYSRHMLWCVTKNQETSSVKAQELLAAANDRESQKRPKSRGKKRTKLHHDQQSSSSPTNSCHDELASPIANHVLPPSAPPMHSQMPTSSAQSDMFVCNVGQCRKDFRSEVGLKAHQADSHGVGGQGLDLHGKDSWMVNQRIREQLKNQGLLRAPGPIPSLKPQRHSPNRRRPGRKSAPPLSSPMPPPSTRSIGSAADVEQANVICAKILRLLLQMDISIQHDGRIICSGIAWTRISVDKQADVIEMFSKLTHLPAKLQATQYLTRPKTFSDEYQVDYPAADFSHSPDRLPGQPRFGVVAISCSKIMLADGRYEVVKIAAVDVATCRILMSHLVSTATKAAVKDWCTSTTGLSGFHDIEAARQAGYKVLIGWHAARAALWRFIDKETIVVGHNLRSDFDTLRMIHGRAVDIAKSVEKAAGGPLFKQQLGLDSLCREFSQVHLTTHPKFGRDPLQNAFAAREFGLWIIKHGDELVKKAKQRTLEYQRINPTST